MLSAYIYNNKVLFVDFMSEVINLITSDSSIKVLEKGIVRLISKYL